MDLSSETYLGIDVGTTGVRAVCIDCHLKVVSSAQTAFSDVDGERNDPASWLQAVSQVLTDILNRLEGRSIAAISVDGTSGTMIATDDQGVPVSLARMYNDTCDDPLILNQIAQHAPSTSAAHGASSGLAKAIQLSRESEVSSVQHEADWIAAALSGSRQLTDENNALKTGYDPITSQWPDWINRTDMDTTLLPKVLRAGQPIGPANGHLATTLKLSPSTLVVAGTTDGCASFLATGAKDPGEAVTVLGSTLTLKLLSAEPIFAPEYGIYSHKIGNSWLTGGASNSGGAVLAHYFNNTQLKQLSTQIDPSVPTKLDYYPLLRPGERFPINDRTMQPRVKPRPDSDSAFLHALLQGITNIEKRAYQRLVELGGPPLLSLRTVGGGSNNSLWTTLRQQTIDVPFLKSLSGEAAFGAAILAKRGAQEWASTS